MKINIIGTGLFHSGGMRIIFEYGNRLSKRGHDVYYYFPFKPYKFTDDVLIKKSKRYYWIIKDNLFNRKSVIQAYNCIFKIKGVPLINDYFIRDADVIIATQWPTAYDVNDLSNIKGNKIYFLQDYEVWNSDKKRVDNALYLNLKKITISKYNQKFFSDHFKINTEVILNGLDFNVFNEFPAKSHRRIKKVITFIDHPLADKGTETVINVVRKLKKDYNNLEFISYGHKKYHNIPEYVKFYINPDDNVVVRSIFEKTNIFLYPSLKEGFALPPAEAMACNCAVVTTPVGAVPEYSINNETAIFVKPGDVDDMYNAVVKLLNNSAEIERLSLNAGKHIRKILDWDTSVRKFEKFIKN